MAWRAETDTLQGGRVQRHRLFDDAGPCAFADVLRSWQDDPAFVDFFVGLLRDAPFGAFRFETPPVTHASLHRTFEFVLLAAEGLERPVRRRDFAEHFGRSGGALVLNFMNLGGDARLVVPTPDGADDRHHGHLASFSRGASAEQNLALWRAVGAAMESRVGEVPVWLSTAGMGTSWLHVRLDDRPKYYGHAPYAADD